MKRFILLAVCLAAVSLGACTGDTQFPEATGKGNVRALNAIPTSPGISFLIEERLIGLANYKNATTSSSFDDLSYTFNFEVLLAGDSTPTRIVSQFLDVAANQDYTLVIRGTLAAPDISVLETGIREWSTDETVFEVRFAHLAAGRGDLDIYFAAPGIAPVLGSQLATLSIGDFIPVAEYEAGEFVMTVTLAGDPTMVLFESETVTPIRQTSLIFGVFDSDPNDVGQLSVRLMNTTSGGTGSVVDANFPPTARFFHASFNFPTSEIYIDDPLTTPIVMNHAFGNVTGDIPILAGDVPITYTLPNMGMMLIDLDRTVLAGTRNNYYVVNDTEGTDVLVGAVLDRRPVETLTRISVLNTAANHGAVDVYVVAVDDSIDEALPLLAGLVLGGAPISVQIAANSYDLYVTPATEKTVLTGPVRRDLATGDVVEAIVYDNVDPSIANLVFIPLP